MYQCWCKLATIFLCMRYTVGGGFTRCNLTNFSKPADFLFLTDQWFCSPMPIFRLVFLGKNMNENHECLYWCYYFCCDWNCVQWKKKGGDWPSFVSYITADKQHLFFYTLTLFWDTCYSMSLTSIILFDKVHWNGSLMIKCIGDLHYLVMIICLSLMSMDVYSSINRSKNMGWKVQKQAVFFIRM